MCAILNQMMILYTSSLRKNYWSKKFTMNHKRTSGKKNRTMRDLFIENIKLNYFDRYNTISISDYRSLFSLLRHNGFKFEKNERGISSIWAQ